MSRAARPISSLPNIPLSTLLALTVHGYETVADLQTISEQDLAGGLSIFDDTNRSSPYILLELNIPLEASQHLLQTVRKPQTPAPFPTLTQSAASMTKAREVYSTHCSPIDKLLGGGLPRGHILEISGPPGTPKANIATNIVQSFVDLKQEVLFVGTSSISTPQPTC